MLFEIQGRTLRLHRPHRAGTAVSNNHYYVYLAYRTGAEVLLGRCDTQAEAKEWAKRAIAEASAAYELQQAK